MQSIGFQMRNLLGWFFVQTSTAATVRYWMALNVHHALQVCGFILMSIRIVFAIKAETTSTALTRPCCSSNNRLVCELRRYLRYKREDFTRELRQLGLSSCDWV